MVRYIPILAVVGLIFGFIASAIEKYINKIEDETKRKYLKVAVYVVLYFCLGCIAVEVVDWSK